MLWIGEKTERKLNRMGIRTIGDLASYDVSALIGKFGVMGRRFHQWATGHYESTVGGRKGTRKSLGHESTFAANTDDEDLVIKKLNDLCRKVHDRATKRNLLFKTVTVKMRYEDFQTSTHGKTLPLHTNCLSTLRRTVRELAHEYLHENKKIRLVGVRVSSIKSSKGQQSLL